MKYFKGYNLQEPSRYTRKTPTALVDLSQIAAVLDESRVSTIDGSDVLAVRLIMVGGAEVVLAETFDRIVADLTTAGISL